MLTFSGVIGRGIFLSRIITRALPNSRMSDIRYAAMRDSEMLPYVCKLVDRDSTIGINGYNIIGYDRPIWLPEGDLMIFSCEGIVLPYYDSYHGARVVHLVKRGSSVIDCGGFVGLFAYWALLKGARQVIIFEPAENNIECCRRNLSREIRDGRVIIVSEGVWSSEEELDFLLADHGVGNTLITRSSTHVNPGSAVMRQFCRLPRSIHRFWGHLGSLHFHQRYAGVSHP